jgi:hypothetical protein
VSRQLVDTQLALAEAKDRIFHMERSLFWRMRELWQSARTAIRPPVSSSKTSAVGPPQTSGSGQVTSNGARPPKGPGPAAGKSER